MWAFILARPLPLQGAPHGEKSKKWWEYSNLLPRVLWFCITPVFSKNKISEIINCLILMSNMYWKARHICVVSGVHSYRRIFIHIGLVLCKMWKCIQLLSTSLRAGLCKTKMYFKWNVQMYWLFHVFSWTQAKYIHICKKKHTISFNPSPQHMVSISLVSKSGAVPNILEEEV